MDLLAGKKPKGQLVDPDRRIEEKADVGLHSLQKIIGIQKREFGKHNVQQRCPGLFTFSFFVTFKELLTVGRQFVMNQIGMVQLRQQLNDFFLTRRFIRILPRFVWGSNAPENRRPLVGYEKTDC